MSDARDVGAEDSDGTPTGEPSEHAADDAALGAQQAVSEGRIGKVMSSEEFSFQEAVGGWRGFIESVAPGFVFVLMFLTVGGMRGPVLAAVATMAILVVIRLIQRTSVQQALSGSVGVAIGAIWAWRTGDPGDYFTPGLWINGIYGVGAVVSMLVRWPIVGVAVGLIYGDWKGWRDDPRRMRAFQRATGVLAAMFALRLMVQVPLALADQTAALGTARLAMGVPLFALTLWVVWLMVRNVAPRPAPQDPPPPTQ